MEINSINTISNYKKAFTQVDELLKSSSNDDQNKIPLRFRTFVKQNKDKEYSFTIDLNKSLKEQEILLETKVILSLIYRSYFCTVEEKNRLRGEDIKELEFLKEQLNDKYNSNNIFEKKQEMVNQENHLIMVVDKLNFYEKIKNSLFKIIKRLRSK